MNARRTPSIAAFALAFVMTLSIFSGVAGLWSQDHAGQVLVQAPVASSGRA